ncbi:purine-binding chemotaxis protein CheW [Bacillus pakistanensis]|uniref:Purine-binding chemotaxis protein CheW n=1 Tax=Rossellomorea pakistanensis TaxID=992288 RepID=A0ABS2NG84_9BACI|nr:chemotaxis protein CheW [Bacillus pakistanensis]MBM7586854.1 purine-binding chemotaxis protein CheW [Bacillus pakistanensis]
MSKVATGKEIKVIVFQLLDKEYAIPVNQVQSIEKIQHITRVPKVEEYVKGVINLRGVVIPIIDLSSRFDLTPQEQTDHTRVIIANIDGMEVGLVVDSANDVLDIPLEAIEQQPEVVGGIEAEYISGVAKIEKRLLILLHLDKVLISNRIG